VNKPLSSACETVNVMSEITMKQNCERVAFEEEV